MPKVLVIGRVVDAGIDRLRAREGVEVTMLPAPERADIAAAMPDTDGILIRTSRLDGELIGLSPRLRVVARHGVGYDNIDLAALDARGIPLAVTATANALAVAEHAMFMMLAIAKCGVAFDRAVREGEWRARDSEDAFELLDKTLLLIGCGRIGREVAARARAFGMTVLAWDPLIDAGRIEAAGARPVASLDEGLAAADIVSIHCPRGPETEGLIGEDALARMKRSAVLINTARGGIVDELALAAALAAGRIHAAGLDVFDREPPSPDNPLFGLPNVLLSPHSAGLSREARTRMAIEAAENVLAGLGGTLDPRMVVNPAVLAR